MRVLKVGLTGGIGAGKSTVADALVRLGAVLIDADVLAREAVARGSSGLREVVTAFGADVLAPDGTLDRPALAARVFGDEPARRILEAIIHPRVRARTAELIAAAPPDAIVVNDVPLLVETGLAAAYHLVVVATAAEATRVDRLARTRGMSRTDAKARIRAQAGEHRRLAAADVVLANDGTLADLEAAVEALWRDRLLPFEENLRAGRPVPGPAGTALSDSEPDWPTQAARLIARLAITGGDCLVRVDHIGSTSVPGLPARDVIDIQAVVPDRDAASQLADAAGLAGFVPVLDESTVTVHGGGRPAAVPPGPTGPGRQSPAAISPRGPAGPRRPGATIPFRPAPGVSHPQIRITPPPVTGPGRHEVAGSGGFALANADPGRPASVSIVPVSDPAWREAVLIRDWLRADQAARDGYAEVKRELAARSRQDVGYRRGMAAWLSTALPRARAWAVETGWATEPPPVGR